MWWPIFEVPIYTENVLSYKYSLINKMTDGMIITNWSERSKKNACGVIFKNKSVRPWDQNRKPPGIFIANIWSNWRMATTKIAKNKNKQWEIWRHCHVNTVVIITPMEMFICMMLCRSLKANVWDFQKHFSGLGVYWIGLSLYLQ